MNRNTYCTECRKQIAPEDNYCVYCGTRNEHWEPKEDSFCKKCKRALKDEEQQCPICGQKRDEPYYRTSSGRLYGPPPVTRHYTCPNPDCNHTWTEDAPRFRPELEYCPKCGTYIRKFELF